MSTKELESDGLSDGLSLQSRLVLGPLKTAEVLNLADSVLVDLAEIHTHGVIHGNIRPATIILTSSDCQAKLAPSENVDFSDRDLPLSVVRYLSPEQAGLINDALQESSDLYSFGLVLYESIVGKSLFIGPTAGDVLQQQLAVELPDFAVLGVKVPRVLEEILKRLLYKSPAARYQSAAGVLVDIKSLRAALQAGNADPKIVVGLADRHLHLSVPTFIGREKELAQFSVRLDELKNGKGGVILLESEAGRGKTRLLDEFSRRAIQAGFRIFNRKNLETIFGPENEVPVLSVEDEKALDGLGDREHPVLVVLDDCHAQSEVDLGILRVLENWAQGHAQSKSFYVLILLAFHTDGIASECMLPKKFSDTLSSILHFHLEPFQDQDIRQLLTSMAGALPEEVVQLVIEFAEGSPFFATAVLEGLVETGALVSKDHLRQTQLLPQKTHEHTAWKVRPELLAHVQSSRQAAAFLSQRLEFLSPEIRKLLSVGAVLGNRFDLDLAAQLAEISFSQAQKIVREAQKKHLLWARQSHHVFIHEQVREAFLKTLAVTELQNLHFQAAKILEAQQPKRTYEISFHLGEAGCFELALPYALRGAADARSQHALELAEQHYRIAEKGLNSVPLPMRREIEESLGDVLMFRGRYDEARAAYDLSRKYAEGKFSHAQLDCKMGELYFKCGDLKKSIEILEQGVKRLGFFVPDQKVSWALLALREVSVQFLHSFLPAVFVRNRPLAGAEFELLYLRLLNRLVYCHFFKGGGVPLLWTHFRRMNLSEKFSACDELGNSLSIHGAMLSIFGFSKRAIFYGQRGLEIRREIGDLGGEGKALHCLGIIFFYRSRFDEAIKHWVESLRLLEKTGDRWEVHLVLYYLANCYYRIGNITAAIHSAQRAYQAGIALGDPFAVGSSLCIWAMATRGHVSAAALATELDRPSEDQRRYFMVLLADGIRLLSQSKHVEAVHQLEHAWDVVVKTKLRSDITVAVPLWLSQALRLQAMQVSLLNPQLCQSLLERSEIFAQKGLKLAKRFRNNLPHALREVAYHFILQSAGTPAVTEAQEALAESLQLASQQGAQYEIAQTLYARIQMGQAQNWSTVAADMERLEKLLESPELEPVVDQFEFGANRRVVTLSLLDRFDRVVDMGRQITAALTSWEIYARVQQAAHTLLHGDRALIIECLSMTPSITSEFEVTLGDPKVRWSREWVVKAMTAGRPVVVNQDAKTSLIDSLSGIKSALCVPIVVRGMITRCLYVTHHQVGALFGDEEEKLAVFIAALAGTALENAQGFTEIQELSQTLEADIVERMKAQEQLQSSLKEKEVLLGEVYHRTKNNMQVISSLLSLQSKYVTDPNILGILKENQNRIRSMALVHEKLYQSQDLVNIRFKEYIEGLVQGLSVSYGTQVARVLMETQVDDVSIGIDAAIPCGLIINELVTNCLKYAFPKESLLGASGKIQVILNWLNPELELIVRDNGIGLRKDFDFTKSKSLGLILVKGLVEKQLSGKLELRGNASSSGTEFCIRFKDIPRGQEISYS